jgi:hypothetical protein
LGVTSSSSDSHRYFHGITSFIQKNPLSEPVSISRPGFWILLFIFSILPMLQERRCETIPGSTHFQVSRNTQAVISDWNDAYLDGEEGSTAGFVINGNDLLFDRAAQKFKTVFDPEFFHHIRPVILHGPRAYAEAFGDFPVFLALCNQLQHFALSVG